MKKFAVFTNYGNWDTDSVDSVGFVGFAAVDPTDKTDAQIIEEIAKAVHPDEFKDDEVFRIKVIPHEDEEEVWEEYEVSMYVDPAFDLLGVIDRKHYSDMLIGLIEVK